MGNGLLTSQSQRALAPETPVDAAIGAGTAGDVLAPMLLDPGRPREDPFPPCPILSNPVTPWLVALRRERHVFMLQAGRSARKKYSDRPCLDTAFKIVS